MAYRVDEEQGSHYSAPSQWQQLQDIISELDPNRIGDEAALIKVAKRAEEQGLGTYDQLRDQSWFGKEGLWQNPRIPWSNVGYGPMERAIGERKLAADEAALETQERADASYLSALTPAQQAEYALQQAQTAALPMGERGPVSGGQRYVEDLKAQQTAQALRSPGLAQEGMAVADDPFYLQKLAEAEGRESEAERLIREVRQAKYGKGSGIPRPLRERLLELSPEFDAEIAALDESPEAQRKAAAEGKLDTLLKEGERITKYDEETGRELTMAADSWIKYETQQEFNKARTDAVENFNADLSGGIKGSDLVYAQLAVVLGSVGTGLAGGKNPALEAFNRLIDRDVERQYKEQEARLKNMDLTNEQTQNMLSMAKSDRQNEIAGQLNVIAQSTTDLAQKARIKEVSKQLELNALLGQKQTYDNTAQLISKKFEAELRGLVGKGAPKTSAELKKAKRETDKMRYAVGELKNSFKLMAKTASFGDKLMGYFGKETGFFRDVIRATGAMPKEVATYLNKRTNTLAQVVKALQGSRPSDFDWRKLEVLFPGVLDTEELAMADFEAVEAMVEANARAEMGDEVAAAELEELNAALYDTYAALADKADWKMTPGQRADFFAQVEAAGSGGKDFSSLVKQHISKGAGTAPSALSEGELLQSLGSQRYNP